MSLEISATLQARAARGSRFRNYVVGLFVQLNANDLPDGVIGVTTRTTFVSSRTRRGSDDCFCSVGVPQTRAA